MNDDGLTFYRFPPGVLYCWHPGDLQPSQATEFRAVQLYLMFSQEARTVKTIRWKLWVFDVLWGTVDW